MQITLTRAPSLHRTPTVLFFLQDPPGVKRDYDIEFQIYIEETKEHYDLVSVVYADGVHFWADIKRKTSASECTAFIRYDDMRSDLNAQSADAHTNHSSFQDFDLSHLHSMVYVKRNALYTARTPLESRVPPPPAAALCNLGTISDATNSMITLVEGDGADHDTIMDQGELHPTTIAAAGRSPPPPLAHDEKGYPSPLTPLGRYIYIHIYIRRFLFTTKGNPSTLVYSINLT